MDIERLIRELEKRFAELPDALRAQVLDVVHEAASQERRRSVRELTVEAERERRVEAETLREVLEAINRQARLEETIGEVLKQLSRIVRFDSCSLALLETDGRFRIIAVRGFRLPSEIIGTSFRDPLTDTIRENHWPIALPDVSDDDRFVKIAGTDAIRSWAGIPLMVEGEIIGLLCLDRHRVDPFEEEDLHRAKAVAFSAAAAIRKARLLEQVRRYASLMERVVAVDQAVFAGKTPEDVARVILEGALSLGRYKGGALVLAGPRGGQIAAGVGETFAEAEGRPAPHELLVTAATRLGAGWTAGITRALGVGPLSDPLFLVPLVTADDRIGALALVDPDGETPDDRLMESYASRAAAAYLHAVRRN
jgi:hypothetical protein